MDLKKFIGGEAERVYKGTEVEVVGGRDPRQHWLFSSPDRLETWLELGVNTRRLLKTKWKTLLVIAESGEWLSGEAIEDTLLKGKNKTILCIEASGFDEECKLYQDVLKRVAERRAELREKIREKSGSYAYVGLSWWAHNRHLTLALDNQGRLIGGIYFRRRLKASQISPVYVDSGGDCAELLLTFLSYARRAAEEQDRNKNNSAHLKSFLKSACEVGRKAKLPAESDSRRNELIEKLEGYLQA